MAGKLVAVLAIIAGVGLLANRGIADRAQMEAVPCSQQQPTD